MNAVSSRGRAILLLTIVNAFWGLSFPIMKTLNLVIDQHFASIDIAADPWMRLASVTWMVGLRFAAALALFAICFHGVLRRARKSEWIAGAAIGAVFFAGLVLQIVGLATIPASRSGFLTSLAVVFTPLAHALLHGKRPTGRVIIGVAMALLGVMILTGLVVWQDGYPGLAEDARQVWTVGDTLTTVAAMFFTVQILLVDRLGKRFDSVAFTPGMFATVTALAFLAFAITIAFTPATSPAQWIALTVQGRFAVPLGVLVVFASLLAFAWMNQYQPFVTAIQAAVIYTMEPVFAALWAWCLPAFLAAWCAVAYANEPLTWPLILGGGFVIAANLLALWPERSEP